MSEEQKSPEAQASEAPAVEAPAEKSKLDELKEKSAAAAANAVPNERAAVKAASAVEKAGLLAAAAESVGIQNTLEVVAFGVALAKAIDEAKKDGKIGLEDIGQLFPVAPLVVPMVDGIGQIPKELGDLDEVEIEALMAEAAKLLGGENNAKTVMRVKAALKFAHAGYDLYKAFAS